MNDDVAPPADRAPELSRHDDRTDDDQWQASQL